MTVGDMDPARREQGPRRQRLGRRGTGAQADADVAAGQQGARGASQCEAAARCDGGQEDGDSAGDQRGRSEGAMGCREAPHRKFRGPRRAAPNSAQSERPDLMQRQLVLVKYGERWYRTGQRCLMCWAGGDTQRGVETDSGRWTTSGGDMELRCPLEALGLRGSLFDFRGPHGRFNLAAWGIARSTTSTHRHGCCPIILPIRFQGSILVCMPMLSLTVNLWRPGRGESRGLRA